MAPGTSSMLRARRRDANVKPNRRLDRKSSRGMLYENEELRMRTITINAEVERGQSDIKKLRRENEQLRREIWGLRDEYDKLEDMMRTRTIQEDDEDFCVDYDDEPLIDKNQIDNLETENGEAGLSDENSESAIQQQQQQQHLLLEVDSCHPDPMPIQQQQLQSQQHPTATSPMPPPPPFDGLSVVDEETCEETTPPPPLTSTPIPHDSPPLTGISPDAPTVPTGSFYGTIVLPNGKRAVYFSDQSVDTPETFPSPPPPPIPNGGGVGGSPLQTPRRKLGLSYAGGGGGFFLVDRAGPDLCLEGALPGEQAEVGLRPLGPLTAAVVQQYTRLTLHRTDGKSQEGEETSSTALATWRHWDGTPESTQCVVQEATTDSGSDLCCPPTTECQVYHPEGAYIRINSVRPHTLLCALPHADVTAQEVIDALSPSHLNTVRGVRVVGTRCWLSVCCAEAAEQWLTSSGALRIRGQAVPLEDVSSGTCVVACSGVPHQVTAQQVAEMLQAYGVVLGEVERRLYKGIDTGERLARLRPHPPGLISSTSTPATFPGVTTIGNATIHVRALTTNEIAALGHPHMQHQHHHLDENNRHPCSTNPLQPPGRFLIKVPPSTGQAQGLMMTGGANGCLNSASVNSASPGDRYRSQLNVRLKQTAEDVLAGGVPHPLGGGGVPQPTPPQFFSAVNSNPFWGPPIGNRREMSVSANALNTTEHHPSSVGGNHPSGTNPFIPESQSAEVLVPNTPGSLPGYPITPCLVQPVTLRRPSSIHLAGPSPLIARRNQMRKASSASTDDGRMAPGTPPGLRKTDRKVSTETLQDSGCAPSATSSPRALARQLHHSRGGLTNRRLSLSTSTAVANLVDHPSSLHDVSRSSSSGQDSPRRRRISVYFGRKSNKYNEENGPGGGGGGHTTTTGSEGELSPTNSRRRGGHGNNSPEQVPWCGCWGNGCL